MVHQARSKVPFLEKEIASHQPTVRRTVRLARLHAKLAAGSSASVNTMYYIYVLYSNIDDKFYVGYTEDLRQRMKEHDRKKSSSDKILKNLKLLYYEACLSKTDAQKREKQLKTGFGRKYLRSRLKDSIIIRP